MGKYTQQGSAAFDARIDHDLERIVATVQQLPDADRIQGIVLMGGYGRGEGTPCQTEEGEVPFNDYDLVVIGHPKHGRQKKRLQQDLQRLEHNLTEELGIPVDLYLHTQGTLRRTELSLMNYEMKHGHKVIMGPSSLLEMMPHYELAELPLSEGTRLLLNRGKLLLDVKLALSEERELSQEERERCAKFLWKNHLAFGDCVLLAYQDYAIHYALKVKRIRTYYYRDEVPNAEWMIRKYIQAIQFKNEGNWDLLNLPQLQKNYLETVRYYSEFLLWYEGKRLGAYLPSLQNYVRCLAAQKRESSLLKNFGLNLYLFGKNAFSMGSRWSVLHPRNRLYPALWLLLNFDGHLPLDLGLAARLLGTQIEYGLLTKRFYFLRGRLA